MIYMPYIMFAIIQSDDDEEEMPAEAKMRMRNIGRYIILEKLITSDTFCFTVD